MFTNALNVSDAHDTMTSCNSVLFNLIGTYSLIGFRIAEQVGP